ncbi:hypothetical protein ANOM_009592 [Aspergillus nomiae NRRL 13137]|uniref:ABC bile acid transporter n=1 Tax=Aspergillus nomiae NRRL (strain ATCC 15546 / NRRL 13137 / CBS 260.88 / M93) TaxID=1509407 RepID=A0A0L1IU64_ASPN3|nr:uncharacterized protein ANOM_009592 [Aspergillus nomiae NRRL 13137]KNG83009.1 hypothetical protein ANOM_009592 [Aspergillus nomiae NRRL 13137]
MLIPRRPGIYWNGKPVDAELTVSILNRLSFAWAEPLLRYVSINQSLGFDNLPQLAHSKRAEYLLSRLVVAKASGGKLWEALATIHIRSFIQQVVLTILSSALSVGPQAALYQILRCLEVRGLDPSASWRSWQWVVILGASSTLLTTLQSWVQWLNNAEVCIPMVGELLTAIYAKVLRTKSIRYLPSDRGVGEANKDAGHDSPQSTINLAAVDSERIIDFAGYTYLIPSALLRLLFSCIFLARVIGWRSLCSGIAVSALVTPVNSYLTSRYGEAQQRLMSTRDNKLSILTEMLRGMRQIKFSALESEWKKRISDCREEELRALRTTFIYNATLFPIFWSLSPLLLSSVSLSVYVLCYGNLTASVAFTAIPMLGSLQLSLAILPEFFTRGQEAKVSSQRINKYLELEDKPPIISSPDGTSFQDASVSWPTEGPLLGKGSESALLHNLNLAFPNDGLSIIVGKTGSGKSLLISAILGECELLRGCINTVSSPQACSEELADNEDWIIPTIANVTENPWIENSSIKDNIIFGLPFDIARYNSVLSACALLEDLRLLEDGDLTEVRPNGVNLSGGRRWRLALARALYSRANTLVMDDIFSALDAQTGRHVYKNALTGDLARGRTRIIATHHVGLCLPDADHVVHLNNGTVEYAGKVSGLQTCGPELLPPLEDQRSQEATPTAVEREDRKPRSFVMEEKRETGALKSSVYQTYLRAGGGLGIWTLVLLLYASYEGLGLGRSWWVKIWTGHLSQNQHLRTIQPVSSSAETAHDDRDTIPYLYIYGSLSIGVLQGAIPKTIHGLYPHRFQDWGRRRVSHWGVSEALGCYDYWAIHFPITANLRNCSHGLLLESSSIYLAGAREIKRLESISRSPIYEQLRSSLVGLTTIRAFGRSYHYTQSMHSKIDHHMQASWYLALFQRWLGFRMGLVGGIFSTVTAAIVVQMPTIPASLAGFTLSFALQYSSTITLLLRQYANMELNMSAVERILEYINVESEDQNGVDVPASWPSEGRIEIQDLTVGYAINQQPVLTGLTLNIKANEKVGIVGRTGSGKSSLALALFRFLEFHKGSIHIDGVDISTIKIHDLRRRIALIPQDPVLFSGTVRMNLDPFNDFSDAELENALQRILFPIPSVEVSKVPHLSLESTIAEGGLSLSGGQRQLLCLARAIISKPKIMVLDEATSSVDTKTDASIQQLIQKEFKNSTFIVIAHRLSTIINFDRILVMDKGSVVEFGTPSELMGIEDGYFRRLVDINGEGKSLEKRILK